VSTVGQSDFGGGIFRSPRAPAGSVYDCVNGLIDDELAIYRRGGVAYRSNVRMLARRSWGLADAFLRPGPRTVAWSGRARRCWRWRRTTALDRHRARWRGAAAVREGVWRERRSLVLPSSVDGKALLWAGSKKATYYDGHGVVGGQLADDRRCGDGVARERR
jgi:hypothetical protein